MCPTGFIVIFYCVREIERVRESEIVREIEARNGLRLKIRHGDLDDNDGLAPSRKKYVSRCVPL